MNQPSTTLWQSAHQLYQPEIPLVELVQRLKQTRLFENFNDSELYQIALAGTILDLPSGVFLLREGEDSDALVVLLEGTAEVLKGDVLNQPHCIGQVTQGTVLGEIGLLLEVPRTSSIRTLSCVRIFILNQEAFRRILAEDSGTAFKLCLPIAKTLAGRLQNVTDDIVKLLEQNDALLDLLDRFKQQSNHSSLLGDQLLQQAEELRCQQDQIKQQLYIEIDHAKKARQVAEITKTAYFQHIRQKVKSLKRNAGNSQEQ